MYLDNPSKLYKDLYSLPTMYCYMVAVAEDGQENDLSNLISIVECNVNELHDGGYGSSRWDLSLCETEDEKQQIRKDAKKIVSISEQIKREQKAKYIMRCLHCRRVYYYSRKPKYEIGYYSCHCGEKLELIKL